jgi:hypothetical protein
MVLFPAQPIAHAAWSSDKKISTFGADIGTLLTTGCLQPLVIL